MKKQYISLAIVLFLSTAFGFVLFKTSVTKFLQKDLTPNLYYGGEEDLENCETDGPDEWAKQQYMMTRDPKTGEVPAHLAFEEYERIRNSKMVDPLDILWEERGPLNVGGRTRAIMWDPNDPTHLKFWAGGVSGGLWYNNNIGSPSNAWQKVEDIWENLSISSITYDPNNTQIFYVGTGEGWLGGADTRGLGIWKSIDGGATWNKLISTYGEEFNYIQKVVVHPANSYVYAATRDSGVVRSTDNGYSWTAVLNVNTFPQSSNSNRAADLEITEDGDILATMGFGIINGSSDGIYISATGNVGQWTKLNNGANILPTTQSGIRRIELAVAPSDSNIIYALVEDDSLVNRPGIIESTLNGIYKSTDKGVSWQALPIPILTIKNGGADTVYFSGDQTWYDLIVKVHPNNPNIVFVGGVSLHSSTDGGNTWETIRGIHDDHHAMAFKPGDPQTLIFGNDGGVYMTEDWMANPLVIIDCNSGGYRVTQFHACALHPVGGENYFLGGAQDNGTQQFTQYGMNVTNQVKGADGGYCYIFKNNPSYQIVSTQKNVFFLSRDNGENFQERIYHNLNSGYGLISPWDYDENNDVLYASYAPHYILIIRNVTSNVLRTASYQDYNGLFPNWTTAFKVSPFSERTLFVGTEMGKLIKITNASSVVDYDTTVISDPGFQGNFINCIELGANEDQILVILSNYGIHSVWETLDGGITWTDKEGDLSDFPIYWGIYNPLDYRQVLLATELGVYTTEDITAGTVHWAPANNGMANVRTTMLKIRESDKQVIASTFGRGIFSTNSLSVSPSTKILASDGQEMDQFGFSIATSGDFAIVGAPEEDEKGNNAGAVYLYEQLNNQWTESDKIVAPDGAAEDYFGRSVDMLGDLAIVGASSDDLIGSAYIYRFSGNSWNLEQKITPNDGSTGYRFGNSVAISGDIAAVGAWGSGDIGAVYIFTYQSGNWTQTDKIIPTDGGDGDRFGWSIDLYGNYLIAGSPFDDDKGDESGSAYIYRNDNGWTLDKKINANDGDPDDRFGFSVSIGYQNAVVGAYKDEGINGNLEAGSAYVFFKSISVNWEQTAKLWAQDALDFQWFGSSVAVSGDYIIVGAEQDCEMDQWSGAAYVFRNEGNNWLRQNKLFADDGEKYDRFGQSVYLFGETAIISATGSAGNGASSGSAYIFKSIVNTSNLPILSVTPSSFDVTSVQSTISIQIHNNYPAYSMDWTAYSLDPWLHFIGDSSGTNSGTVTVSVEENLYCPRNGRIIVRAPGALYSPREVFIHQKAGPGTNEVKLFSNDPNNSEQFGFSVDVDGDYAIIGAVGDNEFGNLTGAAYIFERDGCCSWVQKAKLHISDAQSLDNFGQDVAICEGVAVVGCSRDPTGYDQVAFVFEKPADGWQDMTETARLHTSQGTWAPGFGEAIDMSGEYIIIGAKDGSKIFFYEKPESGWQDMEEKIYFSQPNSRYFGITVAIDGAYAVVGTEYDEYGSAGAAYVYKLDWNWSFQAKLVSSDGQLGDSFGTSVDIDNDRIIVGDKEKEAAYIFVRENDVWYEEQKLTGGYSFANGRKNCVSINGDYALVGAFENSDSLYTRTGCAYSFVRDNTGWSFSKQIFASDMNNDDRFGTSLTMSGPYTIIGADWKDNLTMSKVGAAYIYCTEGDIVTSVSNSQKQTPPISYDLKQNYPNPFNPATTIVFELPKPTNVTLKIYTILGEEVTTLVSEELKAGTHKYIWNPVSLASGVYLYRIETKEYTVTKKMVYLK
jgi:hypothetical protein